MGSYLPQLAGPASLSTRQRLPTHWYLPPVHGMLSEQRSPHMLAALHPAIKIKAPMKSSLIMG